MFARNFEKSLAHLAGQTLAGFSNFRHTKNGQCFAHDCNEYFLNFFTLRFTSINCFQFFLTTSKNASPCKQADISKNPRLIKFRDLKCIFSIK